MSDKESKRKPNVPEIQPASEEDVATFELLKRYLARAETAGKTTNQDWAIPIDDEFASLALELQDMAADVGFPGIDRQNLSNKSSESTISTEPVTQEQLRVIWERLINMAKKATGLGDKILDLAGGKAIRDIYLTNLPDRERWKAFISSQITLDIEPHLDNPDVIILNLTPLTKQTDMIGAILGRGHPLEKIKLLKLTKSANEFYGEVHYVGVVMPEEQIFEPNDNKGITIKKEMTQPQAQALLSLLPV